MDELMNIYRKYWNNIIELKRKYPDLSNPLLIDISDSYWRQEVKLFIVGQQTNGWFNKELGFSEDLTHIVKLIEGYKKFKFGLNYRNKPFWSVVRKIAKRLIIDIDKEGNIVWSNLNRMDYNSERPSKEIERLLYEKLPLLPEEVRIAKPDLIIFFTGPDFDYIINALFNNPEMTPFSGKEISKLAKVSLKGYNLKGYRTYHPDHLRPQKLENEFIDLIIEDFERDS